MAEDIALPGEKLKTFRKEAGLTLKAVADELKVSIPFLSMVCLLYTSRGMSDHIQSGMDGGCRNNIGPARVLLF